MHVAIILCALSSIIVWGLTIYSFKVAIGEVKVIGVGVSVYWDRNCDNPVEYLSWGKIVVNPLKPWIEKNITLYVRNENDGPAIMELETSDWNPPRMEKYMRVDWDYDGKVLGAGEAAKVTIFLYINSSIWFESPRIEEFNFNMIVSAKEAKTSFAD